ncbi:hypothetical protein QQF64_015216, partial [Cirrhinus molitorella]
HKILIPCETKTNISLFFAGASNEDTITPDKTNEFAAEGSNVRISCSYSSAFSLLWYRQYPRSAPEFLVLILDSAKETQISLVDDRLTTNIRKNEKQSHVDLEISSAAVSDSALYYCALRPTYPGSTPEFLVIFIHGSKEAKKSDVDPRFTAKPNKEKQNHVDLEISSAKMTDSSLYYCAMEPTVTGNTKTLYKNLTHS